MELITLLALLVPSAEPPGAVSQVPPTRCASLCTPIHAFAKHAHLFSPGSSSPCQHLPGYLHWDGTKHLKLSTYPLSSLPFSPTCHSPPSSVLSISGVSIIIYQVAQGTDSVSLHIHPGSTHPLLVWPPKVLFHLLSFLHPVATVPGQLTKVLPLMPPTLS